MREALDAYVQQLEARVRFYMKRAEDNHDVNYHVAMALARVVGDFIGAQRLEGYESIQQERIARAHDQGSAADPAHGTNTRANVEPNPTY